MLTKVPGPNGTELVTGLSLDAADKTLSYVEDTEHMVFAAVLLLAVVLGTVLVELSLRPLRRVAATATRVTQLPLDSGAGLASGGCPRYRPADGGGTGRGGVQPDAFPRREGAGPPGGERGPAAPVRRGRLPRAAHATVSHPRLRRAGAPASGPGCPRM